MKKKTFDLTAKSFLQLGKYVCRIGSCEDSCKKDHMALYEWRQNPWGPVFFLRKIFHRSRGPHLSDQF